MTVLELKKYIFQEGKIEFILNEIGCGHILYHPSKEYYSCSNCDGDNKAAINIKNNEYLNCKNYTREKYFDEKSDLLTLVQYNKHLKDKNFSFYDTIKYLHKILRLPLTFKKEEKKKEKIDPLYIFKRVKAGKTRQNVLEFNVLDENILHDFIPCIHIDLFREGIIVKTIKKFGLAYSYKRKRTIFPIRHWMTGELLGYNARTSVENYDLFDIPKYFITPGYQKQNNIYGLYENYQDIKRANYITLFESEKSVCKRDSRNDSTGVALEGHSISDEQVRIIIGLDIKEVVIAMDKDVSIDEVRYMCEKFYGIRKVSYIWDTYDLLKEKDSPADAENKIYNFLFEFRKVYDEKEHKKYLKSLGEKSD